ncbi:Extracellular metalloproteinase MEP [Psilocybe cubensis]|uniref:Extracellular metalloproteinase MEP n=1 Tax=Psilocybe cubensis TaxID=181762 RepID=A0ACB8GPD7_PSICU|nr:Extracellular metalloproteinase MEP [Psilocybe cubensis]KAH9477345.1 Extracellular metalloproteinase MEP [Psilocybe cubensis]
MVSFNKFFVSVFLAVTYASSSWAVPSFSSLKHTTHRVRELANNVQLEVFNPPSTFEAYHPLSKRAAFNLQDSAKAFIGSHLSVDPSTVEFHSGFSGDVAHHAFLKQTHAGIPFANAVANVAFNNDNKVVSVGSSFVKPTSIASTTPSITVEDAIATAEKALNGKFNDFPPSLEFFVKPDNSVVLTHVVQIRNVDAGVWVEAFVDAHANELVSIVDFVTKASYRVLPIQDEILTQGFSVLTDPADPLASPFGWHATAAGGANSTGNNAVAFKGSQSSVTTQSSSPQNFIFTQNPANAPTTQANLDAARTNAFYVVNTVHDVTYRYGFTEAAFNFQTNNNGKGGKGNDRVTISVQDSAGTDNADFSTPADGTSGAMRMFLWDLTSPERDGALENDIVSHEMTHGVTNRMTGGGTGRCLQTTEAGGMGEGWSDTMANWLEKTSAAVPDYVMGQYVTNDPAGIRSHPYSTSATVNPLRYSSLKTLTEVHDIGEVWANLLYQVYAALVGAHGWSATSRTNPDGTEGNIVFMHLFIDSLPLQPCNPTFLTARNAWIQADVNRFGGANKCILWNAFASRGLGVNAANHNDDTTVPAGC